MAKKKHTVGKLIAVTTAAAAAGGICYVFRNQIKESSIYQKSIQCIDGLLTKVREKMDVSSSEDDFFFDDEADFDDSIFSTNTESGRDYTSITIHAKEPDTEAIKNEPIEKEPIKDEPIAPEKSDDVATTFSDTESDSAPKTESIDNSSEDTIPTITFHNSFGTSSPATNQEEEAPSAYENEGLSDVYEDPDVLEEQDKLDF